MGTLGINTTNMAINSVTRRPSNLFPQIYTSPFTYGIPTWTPTPPANVLSQLVMPLMPIVSRIPFNTFNHTSFVMSHIPLLAPSLVSGYIPFTSRWLKQGTEALESIFLMVEGIIQISHSTLVVSIYQEETLQEPTLVSITILPIGALEP